MYGRNNCTPKHPIYVDENQNYNKNNNMTDISNKRSKEAENTPIQPMLQVEKPTAVSSWLKLSYGDNEHNSFVAIASGNMQSLPSISPIGDVVAEFERQKKELNHYVRIQEEEFAKRVKEMRKKHMTSFLKTIKKGVSKKILEKKLEMDTTNRKNRDLAKKIRETVFEAQNLKHQACINESMVHALQNNLKQVLTATGNSSNADQEREGCGDSEEVDDVNSQSKLNMNCKICGRKEVCMLILPCKHLCICEECDVIVTDGCPICLVTKIATIKIFCFSLHQD